MACDIPETPTHIRTRMVRAASLARNGVPLPRKLRRTTHDIEVDLKMEVEDNRCAVFSELTQLEIGVVLYRRLQERLCLELVQHNAAKILYRLDILTEGTIDLIVDYMGERFWRFRYAHMATWNRTRDRAAGVWVRSSANTQGKAVVQLEHKCINRALNYDDRIRHVL